MENSCKPQRKRNGLLHQEQKPAEERKLLFSPREIKGKRMWVGVNSFSSPPAEPRLRIWCRKNGGGKAIEERRQFFAQTQKRPFFRKEKLTFSLRRKEKGKERFG